MTTVAQTLTTWQDGDATRTVAVEGDIVAIRQTYNDAVDGAIVAAIPLRAAIALARQLQAHHDWMIGFNLYADGKPDSDCRGQDQHRGWWSACDADAHVIYADHCVSRGMTIPEPDEIAAWENERHEQWCIRTGNF